MITVNEYAEQNGIPVAYAIEMIQRGTLNGVENDGVWHIDPTKVNDSLAIESPTVVALLNTLSGLGLIGGIVMALALWPNMDYGIEYYIPPIAWATAGIVQSILFAALAKAITYLSEIEFNTRKA